MKMFFLLWRQTKILGLLGLILLSCNTCLAEKTSPSFEFILAGGPHWMNTTTTNQSLRISSYEVDTLKVTNSPNTGIWNIGFGYDTFIRESKSNTYFNRLLVEANLYSTAGTFSGNVWQYQLPEFNNYLFNASFQSTRLMFDLKPTFVVFDSTSLQSSLFGVFGLGAAFNNLGYSERVIGSGVDPTTALDIPRQMQTNVAYELGVGLRQEVNQRFSAFIEYLYAYLGKTSSSHAFVPYNTTYESAPSFSLNSQSVLFGIHLRL